MTVVDIHCHVFNADDLPIRGFLEKLHLDTPALGGMLSVLVDRVIQSKAPGYGADMPRIEGLLAAGRPGGDHEALGLPNEVVRASGASLEATTDALFAELAVEDPVFLHRLGAAAASAAYGEPIGAEAEVIGPENLGARLADARRMIRWARIFGMSRVDIARELVDNFSGKVDLFCPLLVDLGPGLGDRPGTTMAQQVDMLEGISVLSMRSQLPGVSRGRLHPFVGFDPRAQVRAEMAGLTRRPFDVVRNAVEHRGFLGVKLYPPMGWRPLGNSASVDMTAAEAQRLDGVLRDFYRWCQQEDVPITAHANRSNYAHQDFADFAGPVGWVLVLEEFPDLRVNLGHFGGATGQLGSTSWPVQIVDLALAHKNVYVDTGNHKVHDTQLAATYLGSLATLLDTASPRAEMLERIMFGSDWFMLAGYPDHKNFLSTYRALFDQHFGSSATTDFLGGNALRFLGLDQVGTGNATRLRAFYARHAPQAVPIWLSPTT